MGGLSTKPVRLHSWSWGTERISPTLGIGETRPPTNRSLLFFLFFLSTPPPPLTALLSCGLCLSC